jgi:hypothetical protein
MSDYALCATHTGKVESSGHASSKYRFVRNFFKQNPYEDRESFMQSENEVRDIVNNRLFYGELVESSCESYTGRTRKIIDECLDDVFRAIKIYTAPDVLAHYMKVAIENGNYELLERYINMGKVDLEYSYPSCDEKSIVELFEEYSAEFTAEQCHSIKLFAMNKSALVPMIIERDNTSKQLAADSSSNVASLTAQIASLTAELGELRAQYTELQDKMRTVSDIMLNN